MMNVLEPISTIMTKDLITVSPNDKLEVVKTIFDNKKFHHIPVVSKTKLVGIISKIDLLHFIKGLTKDNNEDLLNLLRLRKYTAAEIMTTKIAKLHPGDRITVALKIFEENLFHSIPIVEKNNDLVGLLTTYDIIKNLAKDKADLDQYQRTKTD